MGSPGRRAGPSSWTPRTACSRSRYISSEKRCRPRARQLPTSASQSARASVLPVGLWGKLTTVWGKLTTLRVVLLHQADRLRDGVQALVPRERHHHCVAGAKQGAHGDVNTLLRHGHEDLLGPHRVVLGADLPAQRGEALRLRVGQAQVLPELPLLWAGERQQLRHCQRLAVREAQQVLGAELVLGEEPLEDKK